MCGIAGIVDFAARPSPEALDRMNTSLSHRGPDAAGTYFDGPAALGHRRLSIIDVSAGHQPLIHPERRTAIVFNGEIYNYKSLQDELRKKGHTFKTDSDTEVILRAYEEYGDGCVDRLRGMFAFAIWDGSKNQLFAARDRLGIKPFYYFWNGVRFLFASELKAILMDAGTPRDLDPFALDDYLTYLYIPAPRSIFKSIRKLHAGHTLTVSADGLKTRQYWDLSFAPRNTAGEEEAGNAILDKLKESIEMHLMSEVPLGAFLSGGVDSSAVVAIMAGVMDRPVNTASIGFKEDLFNELPYARMVAKQYRTNSFEKSVEASAATILDTLAWHYDEPFADSSMVPTYYVSQIARERVTVCLSGDGGDENFAGYRRYRFDVLENRLRAMLPAGPRRAIFGALSRIYPKADWLPRMFRAKTLFKNLSLSGERAYFNSMTKLSPALKASLYSPQLQAALGGYDPFSVMEGYFNRAAGWDSLSRIQYVDVKTYLVDDILTKVDRASMAHSLEVRVPLLDHEFMELAAGLPASMKLRGGEGKHIFKKVLRRYLPPEVLDRPKMGFSIPLAQWFKGELKVPFEKRVFAADSFLGDYLQPQAIRKLWSQHQAGLRDWSTQLWALLMLESWGRMFVKNPLSPDRLKLAGAASTHRS